MKTYQEIEQYILNIPKFAGKHTLEDTKRLLARLMGGRLRSKVIHIAGTNGKGSVCAYLRGILTESGCKVGMFTSPHLETMRERICIGERMITEEAFILCFQKVMQAVEAEAGEQAAASAASYEETLQRLHPSFFELLFLMAMYYYFKEAPDYIILETGLGGRLDATNCLEAPELCVITEIGYDHMQYLGDSLLEIAAEKAGIIKNTVPVVFFDKRQEVTEVLQNYAAKAKSQTVIIEKANILNVNIGNKSIDFSLHTGYYKYDSLFLATTAFYQTENASLAVAVAEILRKRDFRITTDTIRRGLAGAQWPGRMEEILPGVYFDGAHNEDGIEAFLTTVQKRKDRGRRLLLFGVVTDKQYRKMIAQIAKAGLFDEIAVAALESDRSASLDELEKIWRQYEHLNCSFHQSANDAYDYLLHTKKDADTVYIAGSLYLIGQLKARMRRIPDD